MEVFINAVIVTLMIFGPAALAMLYARSLSRKTKNYIEDELLELREVSILQGKINERILATIEDLHEEHNLLSLRADKLEARNKSGGKELAKRATKLMRKIKKEEGRGTRVVVNRQLAPKLKSTKGILINMDKPKTKERKQISK